MRKFLGFVLIVCILIFQISYNHRLDSNLFPQSPQELGLDVMTLLVLFFGFIFLKNKKLF